MKTKKSVGVLVACVVFLSPVLFGCEACRRPVSQPVTPTVAKPAPVNGELRVPLNFATIGEAFRNAKKGDKVLVAPGIYSYASGESFPLLQPEEVEFRPEQGYGTVTLDCMRPSQTSIPPVSAILTMGEHARVYGLTFSGNGANHAIEAWGTRQVFIEGCTFHTLNGVRLESNQLSFIKRNLFHWRGYAGGGGNAISVTSGTYDIYSNTIAYYDIGLFAAGATLDMRDNIIGPTAYAGVSMDTTTITNGTDLVIRNDVWGTSSFDWVNNHTGAAMTVPISQFGENWAFDPIFVDREGDFRIKDSSPAAIAGKIAPPRTGGLPGNAPIGAFSPVAYKTDLTFALASASPSGLQAKGTATSLTQVLRWSVMADSAGDVTIKPGHRMTIKLFSPFAGQQAPILSSRIILHNASKKTTVFNHQGSFSLAAPGDPITLDVMYPDTIAAGTSEDYVLIVDTSNAPTGSALMFTVDRFDWSDGVLPRINDGRQTTKVNGNILSF